MARKVKAAVLSVVSKPTNDFEGILEQTQPYTVDVTVRGVVDILFNRWSTDVADGTKGLSHRAQVTMPEELLVYRDEQGGLALPGEHFRMSFIKAGKFFKSPQNPRASMVELLKAGIVVTPKDIPFGVDTWDYLDTRRVRINRGGAINKTRPAMRAGWELSFAVECQIAEYLAPPTLHALIAKSGKFCGVGDFRPSFGRFQVTAFTVREDD